MNIHRKSTAEPVTLSDVRLLALRMELESGRYKALSLDVFDTLLWRRVPEPADVFLLLGRELAAADKLAADLSSIGFAQVRRTAERAAREKAQAATGYREVTLAGIYAALPENIFAPGFDRSAAIAAELACEQRLLVFDRELWMLARAAKAASLKVILVSDTYFSAAELRQFLAAAGCDDLGLIDHLYVSCEAGRPKYRDLFDTVLADLDIAPAQLFHIGDTPEADIAPCRAREIAAVHYDKWGTNPRFQAFEFPPAWSKRASLLGPNGDFGLTGLRARLKHRIPAAVPAAHKAYWQMGAAEFAPVLTAFARWIVGACAARGVNRLYGIMREGRFLGSLVTRLAAAHGVELAVEEIWLSRRAVIMAALYEDDLSLLLDAINVAPGETADELLAGLGLAAADVTPVLPAFDFRQPRALVALSQAIAATPALKEKVLGVSVRHRRNLIQAVTSRCGAAGSATLMDLGYAGTIQSVLAHILDRAGTGMKLSGLYLALNDRALANRREGADLAAFLAEDGFGSRAAQLLSRTPDLLEHACMCRDGSLAAYDDTGVPILLPNQREESQLAQMEALQAGIMAGAAEIDALLRDFGETPHDSAPLQAQVARIIEAMLLHPSQEEADTIGAWRHEANFDLTDRRRLTDLRFDPANLEYQGVQALQDVGRLQVYWPAAAFSKASSFLGQSFAAGTADGYGPEQLTAGPMLGAVIITPDLGVGFDPRRSGALTLAVNPFGRAEFRVVIKAPGPEAFTRVKLTWPAVRAVVAVDHVSFVCRGENDERPLAITRTQWSGVSEISPGVQMSIAAAADLVIELTPSPPFAHALHMLLRFKYLRLAPMFGAYAP